MSLRSSLEVVDLGLCEYQRAYEIQLEAVSQKKEDPTLSDKLYLVEHPRVFTYGRKTPEGIKKPEPYFVIERGGEATYHCPGQLVAYPILTLKDSERDLGVFLRNLEEVIIETLAHWNLKGERKEGATGVWVNHQTRKIASIGVAFKHWVSLHGIALNVDNDLKGFYEISPCGFSPEVMTSMKHELESHCPTLPEVKQEFTRQFLRVFQK